MAIRKNTNPRAMDLQPEMRDILMRNGMQAHIVPDDAGYSLVVARAEKPPNEEAKKPAQHGARGPGAAQNAPQKPTKKF